ncbi:MAG: UDP-glucose/GDP-mannose dehydrogenase family protein [Thermoproteales archaeon]|nr:UDP-glucose/GDP-mannose dehydrogenase family protein [Thermoproteales archaeon]
MPVSIIGLGYVGLTMAVFLAKHGVEVYGVEKDRKKIEKISRGVSPIGEPGVNEILLKTLKAGLLHVTHSLRDAIENSDIIFICVGTPSKKDGSIDLRFVKSVAEELGNIFGKNRNYKLVVVRSTVVPGTTRNLVGQKIAEKSGLKIGKEFGLAMNPEFLKEGEALKDIETPSRIIIGEYDKKSGDLLEKFYRKIYGEKIDKIKVLRTTLENAELIKYANNAFLATKISFINTIANICELVPGCDVVEVSRALGLDPRISPRFLRAGLGYGGSCFPKDVKAIIAFARERGYEPILLEAVDEVNEKQPFKAVEICRKTLGELKNKKIAILGLAFKPNTDDIRNAVSLKIINKLIHEGASVVVYDPKAMDKVRKVFGDSIKYASNSRECIRNADCAIIVTEWEEFKTLKPEDFIELMKQPFVIDGRRIYDVELFAQKGITIKAIGRN